MKWFLSIVLLLITTSLYAQHIVKADSISPEDLGAYKWILRGTGDNSEVVIFRTTTLTKKGDKESQQIYDTVCYSANTEVEKTVFFYNPNYFSPNHKKEPQWHFKAMGASGVIEGQFDGFRSSGRKAEIKFKSDFWGSKKKIFEVLIISYEEAKTTYPKLPEIKKNEGWTWAGSPEN